jgi:hypothetical protein
MEHHGNPRSRWKERPGLWQDLVYELRWLQAEICCYSLLPSQGRLRTPSRDPKHSNSSKGEKRETAASDPVKKKKIKAK